MQPIAVQLLTLQAMLPETTLRLGQSLVARVAEKHDLKGIIMLAGKPIVAELPENVRPGDVLKLAVTDITRDKVVMQMRESSELQQQQQNQHATQVPLTIPFPDGHPAYVNVDDNGAGVARDGEGAVAAIALTYQSPALGPINLRLGMDAGTVIADVRIAAGAPQQIAEATADILRDNLQEKTGRVATVNVAPRPGSFNVSA